MARFSLRLVCTISLAVCATTVFPILEAQETKPNGLIRDGLILDLDPERGVETNDEQRVVRWTNQVEGFAAKYFVPSPIGRETPADGLPTYLSAEDSTGALPTIQFRRQELVNFDEDAFDHLTKGSGYTWFSVMAVYDQTSPIKNTHAFFGNLRNSNAYNGEGTGGYFEGFWGVVHDDRHVFAGTRNGIEFRRNGTHNPEVLSETVLEKNRLYLVAGRMGSGSGPVKVEIFVNDATAESSALVLVNAYANPSKMAIGQERDATNHPGDESFDGELARFLTYDRPLDNDEMKTMMEMLMTRYQVSGDAG